MRPWKEKNQHRKIIANKIIEALRKEGLEGQNLRLTVSARTGYSLYSVDYILSGYREFTADVRRRFLAAFPALADIIPLQPAPIRPVPPKGARVERRVLKIISQEEK